MACAAYNFFLNSQSQELGFFTMYNSKGTAGHVRHVAIAGIQMFVPAEYIVSMLPDERAFGQTCKYINDPFFMPGLNWSNIDQNIQKNHIKI